MRHQHHHKSDNNSQLAAVAAVSAVAGALIGVLFAPRKGLTTRQAVRAKLEEMKSKTTIPDIDTIETIDNATETARAAAKQAKTTVKATKATATENAAASAKPKTRAKVVQKTDSSS